MDWSDAPVESTMDGRGKHPSIAQLRALVAAHDRGSITEGALDLDVTQSAVSHSIAEMERNLGVKLLRRGRNGVVATTAGSRILVHARGLLRLLDSIQSEARAVNGHLTGTLRIASFRSAATHLLPILISLFHRQYPEVNCTVLSLEGVQSGVELAVQEGRADIGIAPLPVASSLISWELARDSWMALVPDDGRGESSRLAWEAFERRPFIICNDGGAHYIREYFARHGKTLHVSDQVKDDSVILSMVSHGLGLSVLPQIAVEPVPKGVSLREMPEPFERIIGVVVMPSLFGTPVVSAFLKLLRDARNLRQCPVVQAGWVRLPPEPLIPESAHSHGDGAVT